MKWLCTPSSCWPFGLDTLKLYQFLLISALEIDSATLLWSDPWENTPNFLFLKTLDWSRLIQNAPSTFPPTEISETMSFSRQGKGFSKSLCKHWFSSPQFHIMVSALRIAIHGLNIKELFIYCIAQFWHCQSCQANLFHIHCAVINNSRECQHKWFSSSPFIFSYPTP